MNDHVVYNSAKRAGTFVGKTIACFAAGLMLVADTATRKRNYTTGNVNPVRQQPQQPISMSAPAYTAGKKTRFVCRECGAPIDVKSFRLAHGYTPGKGFLCDNCRALGKAASKYYIEDNGNDGEVLTATCADCGKVMREKSYRRLKKYRVGKKYYCPDCYLKHEDD